MRWKSSRISASKAMWDDERPIDLRYIALAKFLFAYAYGVPGKMPVEGVHRPQLIFASTTGHLPWSDSNPLSKEMNERSARMIAEGDARRALEAAERKAEVVEVEKTAADSEVPETLESVNPDDPRAFGGP